MRRLIPCSLIALVSAFAPTVTGQPGGGGSPCWSLDSVSVATDLNCTTGMQCTEPWDIATIPGPWASATSHIVPRTCRECSTYIVNGVCVVNVFDCGPWEESLISENDVEGECESNNTQ